MKLLIKQLSPTSCLFTPFKHLSLR
jgi:hypothetical protein